MVVVEIVQDGGALMGLLEGKENRLILFVFTSEGVFELEDDVMDMEVSQVGHRI